MKAHLPKHEAYMKLEFLARGNFVCDESSMKEYERHGDWRNHPDLQYESYEIDRESAFNYARHTIGIKRLRGLVELCNGRELH